MIQRQVPCAGSGLVGHKYDHRLSFALINDHLGHAGALSFHIAGKSVGKQILAGAVKFQFLCNSGAANKCVPGQFVDFPVIGAVNMRHYELQVVTAFSYMVVYEKP